MHFRIRKNVIQFVRTTYDAERKGPRARVVGRIPLARPEIPPELRRRLTDEELAQATQWIEHEQRTAALREELAARTLADTLAAANRWFQRQEKLEELDWISGSILPEIQALRKTIKRVLD